VFDFNFNRTNEVSINDFRRVLIKANKSQANIITLAPNVELQFSQLDAKAIKLVSTPISRLLIGKFSEQDGNQYSVSNFDENSRFSGYLSLDQDKRVYPLLQSEDLSAQLPLVGLWFYGLA